MPNSLYSFVPLPQPFLYTLAIPSIISLSKFFFFSPLAANFICPTPPRLPLSSQSKASQRLFLSPIPRSTCSLCQISFLSGI
ncbi:hypothetical protein PRUPE_1G213000 [Prunus persica]|uniref:Uncharacterized protein n=1 Tax=Prunus persica TaxID=3760 RepID=A0A251R0Z4_PRUPE|nr:hypothetical protein PRUPE_1G213000 [Prunus persica]ONI29752.1 hypothetical protein PRUPE_1G213000 [Prunus persica]ONI29753.1 hypothetical protein PRUPE_1G213000 [Prunus persica]